MMTECESGLFVGVSGHEILLAFAVFLSWQRRMSLGQGGVEKDGFYPDWGKRG